jgi:putative phosphoesterase
VIVAVLGDVHGNLPALEAVLAHADQNGAEAIWNVGDFVGYNAFPDEVVRLLRERGAVSIRGNYDRKALKVKNKLEEWQKTKAPEKWLAFLWAFEHLTGDSRKYLKGLPFEKRLNCQGWRVLLVHGSPADPDEYLDAGTDQQRFDELATVARADLVGCGHSHVPFTRQSGDTWFINPGTVGRPDDGDPRASYALLRLEPGLREVQHYRVPYDVGRAVQAIRENDLPEEFAQMILNGKDLNTVKDEQD